MSMSVIGILLFLVLLGVLGAVIAGVVLLIVFLGRRKKQHREGLD